MSKIQLQSATVEENFVFGSPPLLNGFSYNTCCSQEAVYKGNQECFAYSLDCDDCEPEKTQAEDMAVPGGLKLNGYNRANCANYGGYVRNYSNFHGGKHGYRNSESVLETLSQLHLNNLRTNQVENGIKILEQAGIRVSQLHKNEPVFKKRKDLRALKAVLSNERFREVVMKFGDGDEGGKEILESVHQTMNSSNQSHVRCLFCANESQVYENFPAVDGTLFLTPVRLSRDCLKFVDPTPGKQEKYMAYICVHCMEGKPKSLRCCWCSSPWNGSFFQIGTLYSYNILSAIPCCHRQVSCKKCDQPVIDIPGGEATTLYFSHFSQKTTCPHCLDEDFHFIKSLSHLSGSEVV